MNKRMNEQITEPAENEENPVAENESAAPADNMNPAETDTEMPKAAKSKFTKKKITVFCIIGVVVIVLVAFAFLHKSKFEKVKAECVQIAGIVTGSGDYFIIDTRPDAFDNTDLMVAAMLLSGTQEDALEAIQYANEELGFNGSVYSHMLETSAMMGRQSAENNKYRVSWTYHPDDGLEVTYEKK